MNVNIVSWNMQGHGIEKLTNAQKYLIPGDIPSVILIQEAGVLVNKTPVKKYSGRIFNGLFAEHEKAKNKRCTTGVFADTAIFADARYMKGIAKRPIVYAKIVADSGEYIIATIHATAFQDTALEEISEAFLTMNDEFYDCAGWILMGDFNCSKKLLTEAGVPDKNIEAVKVPTQSGGHTLDYAVFSDSLMGKVKVTVGTPWGKGFVPLNSDHYPIDTILDI